MRNGRAAAVFVAVLLASFAVMNALPANDLPQACVQEAVLALAALAGVWLAVPNAFKRCTYNIQQRNIVRFAAIALLLTGFVGGAIALSTWCFTGSSVNDAFASALPPSIGEAARSLALLLGVCALTGVYEEAFTRVLSIEAIEGALKRGEDSSAARGIDEPGASRNSGCRVVEPVDPQPAAGLPAATKRAILVSALLFAVLHVGAPDMSADQSVFLQTALKFVQALLFGAIVGILYAKTRCLWPCASLHAGFDALYLGPNMLISGTLPSTYASGSPSDSAILCVTAVMLLLVFLRTWKKLAI